MADLHILEQIWGDRRGYVFVPRWQITGFETTPKGKKKPLGDWNEGRAFKWPTEKEAVFARINQSAAAGYEMYFCPIVFPKPSRLKDAAPAKLDVMWADDLPDPETANPMPTIAWKTSDNSHQAVWLLDEEAPIEQVEAANKALAYSLGADKSGWDISQVLRVPGLPNRKYTPVQQGKLLWDKGPRLSIESVATATPEAPKATYTSDDPDERLTLIRELIENRALSARTQELLLVHAGAVEPGIRSERLWELEKLLMEDGLAVTLAAKLVKLSAWNKFKGRRDEDTQIIRELLKAEEEVKADAAILTPLPTKRFAVGTADASDVSGSGVTSEADDWLTPYDEFVSTKMDPPSWVVQDIWQEGYGIIAGEPKTYKSFTAMDLGLSVCTGKPFLGKFPVRMTGPVILIQEENGESTVQDRLFKIARYKGILQQTGGKFHLPANLAFWFANNYGVTLTDERWRKRIEATVQSLGAKLLILDPLYMMIGNTNENDASEMNQILTWLTSLRNKYGCYALVVHHYKKGSDGARGGQRIRGTSAFHGWVETGLYLSLAGEVGVVKLEREFRSMSPLSSIKIKYDISSTSWYYHPTVIEEDEKSGPVKAAKKDQIIVALGAKEIVHDELKAQVNVDGPKFRQWIAELKDDGILKQRRSGTGQAYQLTARGREELARINGQEVFIPESASDDVSA